MQHGFWRKTLIISIILILIGSSSISLGKIENKSTNIKPLSRGNTLYVGGSGPNNYTRIQDAVDAASDGDIIFVYSGRHKEIVYIVEKSVTLLGEDKNTNIIEKSQKQQIIFIKHDFF